MMNRRPALFILAAPLVLAACGGSTETAPSSAAPAAQQTTAAPGSAVAPAPAASAPTTAAGAPAAAPPASAPPASPTPTKLNLNTATREQLLTVPNAGDRMAREFLEYRPYRSIGQFRREIGKYVSQEQVTAYERYLYVPVDPNAADADTLLQLPGMTAPIAQQLIAARPFASPDAFVARLGQLTTPDQAAAARAYLTA